MRSTATRSVNVPPVSMPTERVPMNAPCEFSSDVMARAFMAQIDIQSRFILDAYEYQVKTARRLRRGHALRIVQRGGARARADAAGVLAAHTSARRHAAR